MQGVYTKGKRHFHQQLFIMQVVYTKGKRSWRAFKVPRRVPRRNTRAMAGALRMLRQKPMRPCVAGPSKSLSISFTKL